MRTADFDYSLPPDLIAQHPAPERTQARMMVIDRVSGDIRHQQVKDLPAWLTPGDLLVVNDTRVFPARLFGRKAGSGGRVEILLIEETESGVWEALMRVSRAPLPGAMLDLAGGRVRAEVLGYTPGGRVRVRLSHDAPILDILEQEGLTPLPPYIKRPPPRQEEPQSQRASAPQEEERARPPKADPGGPDRIRYQTVFARETGAVAAPTAGLHFTPDLLRQLADQGMAHVAVTLHVGPGTFRPVSVAEIERHAMEAERYRIPAETAAAINAARSRGGRIVAVGSTVVRTLETAAGEDGRVTASEGRSALFIYPGYRFRIARAMLTNFHLPRSTLLMMVSAFAGQDLIRRAYATAIRERYRFFSYGDCMLIR